MSSSSLSNMAAVAAGQPPIAMSYSSSSNGGAGFGDGGEEGGSEARGGPKRQWLTKDQSDKLEELYKKWHGDWRGHEAELEEVSEKLDLKVTKIKKRLDYLRRRREGDEVASTGLLPVLPPLPPISAALPPAPAMGGGMETETESSQTKRKKRKRYFRSPMAPMNTHALYPHAAFHGTSVKWVSTTLNLVTASAIVDKAIHMARSLNLLPLALVVLDSGGNYVVLKKEDGAGIMRTDVARAKAWGALAMGCSSRSLRDRMADRPALLSAFTDVSGGKMVAAPGGVLIMSNTGQEVVGAMGVSGDTSDKDEYVAIEAIKSVGLRPDPATPDESWLESSLGPGTEATPFHQLVMANPNSDPDLTSPPSPALTPSVPNATTSPGAPPPPPQQAPAFGSSSSTGTAL